MASLPPPRVPRRRISGPERRARILRAAVECFASRGFSGTTTREVAARAGITEAGLYRHFASKEALYAAIIDEKMQAPELAAGVAEAAARSDDRAVLRGLGRELLERGLGDPAFVRLLFFSALEGHALAEAFFEARVRSLRGFLADYLARRMEEGGFRAVDPVLAARAFLGMVVDHMNVVVVFAREDLGARSPDEVVESFVDIFLAGIRKDGAASGDRDGPAAAGPGR